MAADGGVQGSALEKRIADVADSVSELKDLELVNKLDILNLSNELEKMRLMGPAAASAGVRGVERLEQAVAELEAEVAQLQKGGVPEAGELEKRVEALERAAERGKVEVVERRDAPAAAVPGCHRCGNVLRAGAKFCGTCGASARSPLGAVRGLLHHEKAEAPAQEPVRAEPATGHEKRGAPAQAKHARHEKHAARKHGRKR